MILEYIHPDANKEIIELNLEQEISKNWVDIKSNNKIEFIKKFLPAYNSGQKLVLFDITHKQLLDFFQDNNIDTLENISTLSEKQQILFFTSGTNGFPIGAFKSKDNLEKEVKVLAGIVEKYKIKRVVVTVPFVHIYGVLAGILLPLYLSDVKLVVKDDFLPYELLDEALLGDTLVITTPVFIKALSQLNETKDLSSNLFVSSTGPLHKDDVLSFELKYSANLLQLFGSTETGGIAYKLGSADQWKKMPLVNISTMDEKLHVVSPFVSEYILQKEITPLIQPFQTEDIVEINGDEFSLLGRSNKLIKIAGKRISALQIESLLEDIPQINKAIVTVVYKKELLRSEQILITLESSEVIKKHIIKNKISERYGTLTIPFSIKYVDKINYSSMGKKVLF